MDWARQGGRIPGTVFRDRCIFADVEPACSLLRGRRGGLSAAPRVGVLPGLPLPLGPDGPCLVRKGAFWALYWGSPRLCSVNGVSGCPRWIPVGSGQRPLGERIKREVCWGSVGPKMFFPFQGPPSLGGSPFWASFGVSPVSRGSGVTLPFGALVISESLGVHMGLFFCTEGEMIVRGRGAPGVEDRECGSERSGPLVVEGFQHYAWAAGDLEMYFGGTCQAGWAEERQKITFY